MKKLLVVAVAVSMVLMATSAFALIAGSKHDLSLTTGGSNSVHADNTTLSSCQFCHTPHNGVAVAGAPLWNRTLPNTTYTFYATAAASTTAFDGGLGPNSLTCLSCHDGTVSVGDVLVGTDGVFTANANVNADGTLGATQYNLGTDLTNDHPVGFVVDDQSGKAGLTNIAAMQTAGAKFYTGRMECATCHDPHQTTYGKFLRWSGGSMCSDCHALK
ncbi:MAG: cytochrome c3 family protein [Nitrospirota bacterium]|nr:cytochrome c3 family protein [Nitrospirota bacterium]